MADIMVGASVAGGREHRSDRPLIDDYLARMQSRLTHLRAKASDREVACGQAA